MSWRNNSAAIESKGSAYKKLGLVKSLADLHGARSVHDSQFFTPEAVVDLIWKIVNPLCDAAYDGGLGRAVPILDNSIGAGALLSHADPEKHAIYGCDIDSDCIEALEGDLAASKFHFDLRIASIAEMRIKGMGLGIINPPFSIHLASPSLVPGGATCFGKYGPNTHAISHDYALEQALRACQCVIAVLPSNFARSLDHGRLIEVIDLPANAFAEEEANVMTSIAVFSRLPRQGDVIYSTDENFDLKSLISRVGELQTDDFRPLIRHFQNSWLEQTICTPVTGNLDVRVYRSGDYLKLEFKCGFVEAQVLNGIYRRHVDHSLPNRIPSGVKYEGEGILYLPYYFVFEDPLAELQRLEDLINALGGCAVICSQVKGYIRRRSKNFKSQMGGYSRWIQSQDVLSDKAEVLATFVANPRVFPSPVIKKGEMIDLISMDGAEWHIGREDGSKVLCMRERVQENIRIERGEVGWKQIGSSMASRYTDKAKQVIKKCEDVGAFEFCSWDYQREDLIESLMSSQGLLISQQQGLGKSRLGFGAALASPSGKSIIIMLPSLLDQFIDEAKSIGVDINVIRSEADTKNLGAINLITTTRLRCRVNPNSKRTFSKALRNRFGTVILDEADLLRNTRTQQSRAIIQLGGVRKIGLSGTPVANYPRNLIGLSSWVFGEGNVINPFSAKKPFVEEAAFRNCTFSQRGIDVFNARHTCFEWATMEFREDNQQGAKREIPAIRNLDEYREYASRMMVRRLRDEPKVGKYFPKIKITEENHVIAWNPKHLGHYIAVAEDFKRWFEKANEEKDKKNLSLVVLLARIGAVIAACNNPSFPTKNSMSFDGQNSKVEATLDLIENETEEGRKSIVFLHSAKQALLLKKRSQKRGIKSIILSGDIDQEARTNALRDDFRNGDASVCFATFGVAKYGLNVPEAQICVFYDRCWSHTDEQQALFRVLRPQQASDVTIHYMTLENSIDVYMDQMVRYKRDAAMSGLDYCEPTVDTENFLHMDHIFHHFCEEQAKLNGLNSTTELKQMLLAS